MIVYRILTVLILAFLSIASCGGSGSSSSSPPYDAATLAPEIPVVIIEPGVFEGLIGAGKMLAVINNNYEFYGFSYDASGAFKEYRSYEGVINLGEISTTDILRHEIRRGPIVDSDIIPYPVNQEIITTDFMAVGNDSLEGTISGVSVTLSRINPTNINFPIDRLADTHYYIASTSQTGERFINRNNIVLEVDESGVITGEGLYDIGVNWTPPSAPSPITFDGNIETENLRGTQVSAVSLIFNYEFGSEHFTGYGIATDTNLGSFSVANSMVLLLKSDSQPGIHVFPFNVEG